MTDVHALEETDEGFVATLRPEHEFERVDGEFVRAPRLDDIVQGARVRRGTTAAGTALVHQVRVPLAMLRDADDAADLAREVARRVDA